MKIIDFKKVGNVVRFFLGEDSLKVWYGDDWDDAPYEHNADQVYDEYVSGWVDVAWDADMWVMEPADGAYNSEFCKDDMVRGDCPCIAVVFPTEDDMYSGPDFSKFGFSKRAFKIYFGDPVEELEPGDLFHTGMVLRFWRNPNAD